MYRYCDVSMCRVYRCVDMSLTCTYNTISLYVYERINTQIFVMHQSVCNQGLSTMRCREGMSLRSKAKMADCCMHLTCLRQSTKVAFCMNLAQKAIANSMLIRKKFLMQA